jgi:hypothetical protein
MPTSIKNDPLGLNSRKTDKQILDEALAQQAAGKYEDPMVEAKRTLERANRLAQTTDDEAALSTFHRYLGSHPDETYGGVAARTGRGIGTALSALPGPAGWAAAAGTGALEYATPQYDDHSAEGIGSLAMIPSMAGLAKSAVKGIVKAPGAAYRGIGRLLGESRGMGDEVAAAARASRGPAFKAPSGMPVKPRGQASSISHNDMPVTSNVEDALGGVRFARQTPEVVEGVESVAAPGFSLGSMPKSLADVPTSKKVGRVDRLNRMSEEAVAPYRQAAGGEMAGFSGLPQMSLGELARISANMKRITGQ